MDIYGYWTDEKSEVVHLALERADRTLCGRWVTNLSMGDESASGIATTCGACRRSARLDRRDGPKASFYCHGCQRTTDVADTPAPGSPRCSSCGDEYGCGECGGSIDAVGNCKWPETHTLTSIDVGAAKEAKDTMVDVSYCSRETLVRIVVASEAAELTAQGARDLAHALIVAAAMTEPPRPCTGYDSDHLAGRVECRYCLTHPF